MVDIETPHPGGGKLTDALKSKAGPLPVWGWGIILAGATAGFWLLKRRGNAGLPVNGITSTSPFSNGNMGAGGGASGGGSGSGSGSGGSGDDGNSDPTPVPTTTPTPDPTPDPTPTPDPRPWPEPQPYTPTAPYVPTPAPYFPQPTPVAPQPPKVSAPTSTIPQAPVNGGIRFAPGISTTYGQVDSNGNIKGVKGFDWQNIGGLWTMVPVESSLNPTHTLPPVPAPAPVQPQAGHSILPPRTATQEELRAAALSGHLADYL